MRQCEARREPGSAREQSLTEDGLHARDLLGRRHPLVRVVAHHEQPQRGVADVRRVVECHTVTLDRPEVLGERREVPRDARRERRDVHVLDVLERAGDDLAVLGAGRRDREAAVPRHDRGHAVEARRRERGIPEHLRVVVGVDVDESRRDDVAAGVERALAVEPVADRADVAVRDRDVRPDTGRAGPVDDRAAPDDEVRAHRLSIRSGARP